MNPNPKLHAWIAMCGYCSRREAERLMLEGSVKLNGRVIKNVAERIHPGKDKVMVRGKLLSSQQAHEYWALNKPTGVVSTVNDPDGKPTVMRYIQSKARLFPVGRLDEDSEGLLFLTNDGDFAYTLTHPKHGIAKVYEVFIKGTLSNTQLRILREGVPLKDGVTQPAEVSILNHEQGNTHLQFVLHEGRHRQIRRMCANQNIEIYTLKRVSIGSVSLGSLAIGRVRPLSSEEVTALLSEA
ncbi:MAG: Pseudouridine synthase [Microgenomates group bacterium GW2011_GWF2_45_18]|nr:MAG: Pseudouridine synthase [Microgenomates group bacterium GW2011_GWF1_44_10]KKU01488.1 MAG: Pseudouridine synthase [Microgenomates group bacterium GW2011_GWF2_45_18]OGJ40580.1 MAG: hypothetical protein A2378_01850 [Candidatus Pacebacteria bacterium RIFOXYB1_FULL_44_10]HAU99397.1 pseudouridine synthase [Candidatus Paceibacterota bacterium]HAX01598.1 pseudouridine synthase [Candidatus Paceibacterota bacterium]